MDDGEIVKLYLNRDQRAISETEQKYGKLCFKVANNILSANEDSEECVNDALLKVWESIPPTTPTSLKGYVCKIVRNQALMRLRYNNTQKRSSELSVSLSELEEILPDNRISPSADDDEIGFVISEFLKKQRPIARKVFVLKYVYFFTQKEIAERYSFSEDKVNSMLSRTRKKLREYLIKEGIEV